MDIVNNPVAAEDDGKDNNNVLDEEPLFLGH